MNILKYRRGVDTSIGRTKWYLVKGCNAEGGEEWNKIG